jgi:transposase
MDIVYPCCAGLDVHKQTVVACVRRLDGKGVVHKEVRTFGTMTAGARDRARARDSEYNSQDST